MTFITYAQNFEDLMLWRALKRVEAGFYIDIGAYDPVEYSVTKAFYDMGWRGINVEPTQEWFDKLQQERPADINIRAVAADKAGERDLFLFRNTGLSTISKAEMRKIVKAGFGQPELTKVRSTTIDELCTEYDVQTVHFLKIDAEGAEADILKGAAFTKYRPWILVIEATAPFSNTDISHAWQPYLLDRGYLFAYFDGLNKFFVAKEHEELSSAFSLPPNVIDDYVPASKLALEKERQQALQELAIRDELVKAAEKRAADLGVQLGQFCQQIDGWDGRLKASEAVAAVTARKLAEFERHLIEWDERLAPSQLAIEREAKLEELERQLRDRDERLKTAERLVIERDARLEELERRLADQRAQLELLERELRDRNARLEQSERQSAELIEQAAALREQIAREILQAEAQRADVLEIQEKASALENELKRVYGSISWRITEPLRVANLRRHEAAANSVRAVKGALRRLIFRLHPLVVRNHTLKRAASAILNCFPSLRHRILSILIRRQMGLSQRASHTDIVPSLLPSPAPLPTRVLRHNERIVLFYVEFTALFDRITGIQRVCHKLAGMLESQGEILILVKLDPRTLRFTPLNASERAHFSKQAGHGTAQDDRFYDPGTFEAMLTNLRGQSRPPWLLIPEVTYHTRHPNPPTSRLIKLARDFGLRVGVIYYDVIPFLSSDASENARKHAEYTSTIGLADVIWPISRWTADLLIDYYRRYDSLSDAEMPVISVATLAEEMDTPRQVAYTKTESRSIVCVGTIDERKNQISLIRAFNKYCAKHPEMDLTLHIVGMIRDQYKNVIEKEASQNPRIEFHFHATDDDIKRFYLNCDFTVFPSVEEGYGLPIVESLWNLKPCICANFGSMAEIAVRGGCVAVDTHSVDALLGAIAALIEDQNLYQTKLEEILRRQVKTWFEYAGQIVDDMNRHQFGQLYNGLVYYWVDATLATNNNTGIQRVNRQLARHLILQGCKLVPIKWDESSASIVLATRDDLEHLARWNGPPTDGWVTSFDQTRVDAEGIYLLVELPLNRSLDVQERVVTFFKQTVSRCAAVFYDAIPYKLASMYPPDFTKAHMAYMELLDRMDFILPISGTSAKDLESFLSTSGRRALALENRLRAIDLPAEFPERSTGSEPPATGIGNVCNVLAVGTVEPRKNHETLIRAFIEAEKISPRPLKLTIVGGDESFDKDLPGKITKLIGDSKSITWIRKASDSILRDQYEKAHFTVFPSIEEGFGIPIMESLWFGIPCICSRTGQMAELAASGGCETVDVLSIEEVCNAIVRLASDSDRIGQLKEEIRSRHFKSWEEYAAEVSSCIRSAGQDRRSPPPAIASVPRYELAARPVLSICITTYNRAGWLSINLESLMRNSRATRERIEIVVCDNCSTDETFEVAARYIGEDNFFYFRNTANVGMLNNLPETAARARGEYVWLIGDDDIIHRGALERLIDIIDTHGPDLINVNYAYTPTPEPPVSDGLEHYLSTAIKIAEGAASTCGLVKEISSFNENFYTAIYTFVVKRKYAQKIFNQDTSGEPFSSMQTCVPSSKYILSHMMELSGYWINEPLITINMNVSWGKYAPLWVLERLPEVYDFAELNGVPQEGVDHWREHTLQMTLGFLEILFNSELDPSFRSFDIVRFIRRSRHLSKFRELYPKIEMIYAQALASQHPLAKITSETLKAVMQ
ncbi:FkbM family methyltransferase [Bradyrhizobium oligotrophicum]|uniref:FkbM family methyltransferase n=1 Tax=Bradyrhizobium oligotrophicum TaxID=44255 RepID=UPI003EB74F6F